MGLTLILNLERTHVTTKKPEHGGTIMLVNLNLLKYVRHDIYCNKIVMKSYYSIAC